MPEYLLMYTVNRDPRESQPVTDKRRADFEKLCHDQGFKPLAGHQTTFTLAAKADAQTVWERMVSSADSQGTPLNEQDCLCIVEINPQNAINK
jgi:hypothetical protein